MSHMEHKKISLRSQPPSRGRRPEDGAQCGYTFLEHKKWLRVLTWVAVGLAAVALVSGGLYSARSGFADMCCECVARTSPGVLSATPSYTLNPHS